MSPSWLATLAGYGGATALVEDDRIVTYADLVAEIGGAATRLSEAGIEAGDVIVLNADYSLGGIACFLALASLGTIVVPIVNMTPGACEILREECGARFVCRPGAAAFLESWGEGKPHPLYDGLRARGTAGLILLSSGSTGKPKAILHDLASLLHPRKAGRGNSRLTILLFLLFDHIGGINTLINVLFSGGTAVVATERTPNAICRLVETHRVRVLPASPTFLNLILMGGFHELHDLSSLRLITYGTEPMPDQLLRRVRAAFPRARLLQTFGTSETGIAGTQSASSESTYFRIDDADYEYRIVDGELHLRTKTQFLGYLNADNGVITDDGWFRTGDLVEEAENGYLRIRGRAKEVINVGGEKVLPVELESILLENPLVADCVVYGEPNAITGQMVCADIRPSRPIDKAELRREIHAFLSPRVERFKVPGRLRLVEDVEASERFKKKRLRL